MSDREPVNGKMERQTTADMPTWAEIRSVLETATRGIGTQNSLHHPEIFVGQERARDDLARFILGGQPGSVAVIQDRFGSGKTEMRYRVEHDLETSGLMQRNQSVTLFINTGRWQVDPSEGLEGLMRNTSAFRGRGRQDGDPDAPVKLLVIEEVGRSDSEEVAHNLNILRQLRAKGELPPLLITGEETLSDPRFFEQLGCQPLDITRIELEPLTPDLVEKALAVRISSARRSREIERILRSGQEIDQLIEELTVLKQAEEDLVTASSEFFDQQFLRRLVPPTEKPAATFRSVFAILSAISMANSSRQNPPIFDGDSYREYKQYAISPERSLLITQEECLHWLHRTIRDFEAANEPFPVLNAKRIMQGTLGNTFGLSKYSREVVKSLIQRGFLVPVNTSDFDDSNRTFDRLATFENVDLVPSVMTFLDAHYSPIEPRKIEEPAFEYSSATLTPEGRAEELLNRYLRQGVLISLATYRREWAKLVREVSESTYE